MPNIVFLRRARRLLRRQSSPPRLLARLFRVDVLVIHSRGRHMHRTSSASVSLASSPSRRRRSRPDRARPPRRSIDRSLVSLASRLAPRRRSGARAARARAGRYPKWWDSTTSRPITQASRRTSPEPMDADEVETRARVESMGASSTTPAAVSRASVRARARMSS